jgi:class 3 adenylate cyclase/pimeloyl-ACP methyl ester carboxylesterase
MPEREIRYCTTDDGISIAYSVEGDPQGTPLVWIPGWVSHLEIDGQTRDVLGVTEILSPVRFITFDKRGSGLSSRAITEFSLDAHLTDVAAVVNDLGLSQFALAGYSEGGPVAIAFAAHNPERVNRLTIVCSFADGSRLMGSPEMNQAVLAAVKAEWGIGSQFMADLFLAEDSYAPVASVASYQRLGADPIAAHAAFEFILSLDVRPLLSRVASPTLVLHTRDDRAVPLELGQEIAASIRGARFSSLPGAHYPSRDVWKQINRTMIEFVTGQAQTPPSRGEPAAVSTVGGLRTILFTDLVGHTEMMRRLGDDRGRDVLREHERITRDVLKQHGGAEVKTLGDGFMASFASVTKAVDCAIALQRAFNDQSNLQLPTSNLQVRVGLNAGEPIEEDGDLFGSTVILASRICAQAGVGEILIPEPLRHLLSGKSYVYADRGDTMLKGFEDAIRLYEVRWRQ